MVKQMILDVFWCMGSDWLNTDYYVLFFPDIRLSTPEMFRMVV